MDLNRSQDPYGHGITLPRSVASRQVKSMSVQSIQIHVDCDSQMSFEASPKLQKLAAFRLETYPCQVSGTSCGFVSQMHHSTVGRSQPTTASDETSFPFRHCRPSGKQCGCMP